MTKTTIRILWAVVITVTVVAGFMREKIFYEINARIKFISGESNDHNDPAYDFLYSNLNESQLNTQKWIWTIVFTLIYFGIAWFVFRYLFKRKDMVKVLIYLYVGLILIAGLSYGLGSLSPGSELGYRISRIFMGFLQSPIPLLLLIPAQFIKKS